MSFSSLRAALKSVFNNPEEEIDRRIVESDSSDDMCISKGITENICLIAWQRGVRDVRIKQTSPEVASVYYVSSQGDERCAELPMEQAIYLARRIRVLANIDGWGHSDTKPYEMLLESKEHSFLLSITQFQLKPKLDVAWAVEHVARY
jgi:hypothetical protein